MFGKGRTHWREEDCFQEGSLVYPYHHQNYYAILHSHDFYEINIISSGKGTHHMGIRTFDAIPGDVYVIPPDVSHGYSIRDQLDIYHILLRKDFMTRYADDLEALPGYHTLFEIEPYLRQATSTPYFLHLSPHQLNALSREMEQAIEAFQKESYAQLNIITLHLICELCLEIAKRTEAENTHSRALSFSLLKTLEYIQHNLDQKLSIEALAARSSMSVATFNRHFKQTLKCTPLQYITECRVKKALRLLQQSDLNKTEIALMCGFYDSSHMNKYLRKAHLSLHNAQLHHHTTAIKEPFDEIPFL